MSCLRQRKVIEWLLNHDPALRPTTQELLKSELLPPPQMEESELHEVLQHTMANINGKAYRTMVGQLFAQNTSPVMDYTYDIDLHKVWQPQSFHVLVTLETWGFVIMYIIMSVKPRRAVVPLFT